MFLACLELIGCHKVDGRYTKLMEGGGDSLKYLREVWPILETDREKGFFHWYCFLQNNTPCGVSIGQGVGVG